MGSAVENLWLAPMPDLEFWDFVPFSRPVDWVRSGTNIYLLSNETEAPGIIMAIFQLMVLLLIKLEQQSNKYP